MFPAKLPSTLDTAVIANPLRYQGSLLVRPVLLLVDPVERFKPGAVAEGAA